MKECWIFGGADINDYSFVKVSENAVIIAADGGLEHLKKLDIYPDIVMGDFDSYNGEMPSDCEVITVPVRKDDTDTMLAVKKALEIDCKKITICGALGGRFDHTFANIQTLEYIADHNGYGVIADKNNVITVQDIGKSLYKRLDGWYFSVFSLTDESVVSLHGTSYEIEECILTRGFPLGVSNEITDEFAEIDLKSGRLLIIHSKK